jgi:hypothetical protein
MAFPLAAIPAIIQGATALSQLAGGANKRPVRPEYEIPDSAKQSLALSKAMATSPYSPGYSQAKDEIGIATANRVRNAAQYGNAQESLAAISGQESADLRRLAAGNEQYKERALNQYGDALNQYASYEDQEFQLNELAPYMDEFMEGRHMTGAGIENIFGATDKLAQIPFSKKTKGTGSTMNLDKLKNAISIVTSYNKIPTM